MRESRGYIKAAGERPHEWGRCKQECLRHELLMGDAQARLGNQARALAAYRRARETAGQEADKDPLRARYLAWLDQRIAALR